MNNALRLCEDGSHTLFSDKAGECYHSTHGAYTESLQIFINYGLLTVFESLTLKTVRILEVGFGTGLNALLTSLEAESGAVYVSYLGLEPFPVESEIIRQLNYCSLLNGNSQQYFDLMHESTWDSTYIIHPSFGFKKQQIGFMDAGLENNGFDLIYFDAFSPEAQPELWEQEVFDKCFRIMAKGGVLVTYCAKGKVKRALKAAGFTIENLPGPPGKREITRARKLA